MKLNYTRLIFFTIIIALIFYGIFRFMASVEQQTGTLIFTENAVVFTPNKLNSFSKPDFTGNTGNWYWVGYQNPVESMLRNNCYAALADRGFIKVKITCLNSKISAASEHPAGQGLIHLVLFDIKALENCE